MNLKEYIKTAITDITSAISELQGELVNGAIVSPSLGKEPQEISFIRSPKDRSCYMRLHDIHFDVATTVDTTEKSKIDGGMNIQIFSAGVNSKSTTRLEHVSRISFSIPIAYPSHRLPTDMEEYQKGKPIRQPVDKNTPSTQPQ